MHTFKMLCENMSPRPNPLNSTKYGYLIILSSLINGKIISQGCFTCQVSDFDCSCLTSLVSFGILCISVSQTSTTCPGSEDILNMALPEICGGDS